MTYRSTRTFARRTPALVVGLAALGALVAHSRGAAAADLLVCTGTQHNLRAELSQILVDSTPNGLTPYPIGAANPNTNAGRLDDGSVEITNAIVSQVFPTGIPFIDADTGTPGLQRWTRIFANVNGNITFRDRLANYTPEAIPGLTQPTIAAYFGDVDLRAPGSEFTLCVEPLNERVFITWRNVGYFNAHADLQNSFQIVLTNNDDEVCLANGNFEVEFRFQEDLEWTTGDADGGVNGLGAPEATAGIDAGDTINAVALPGSGTEDVLDLDSETNANEPGVHRFLVAEGNMLPRCGNNITNLCEQCDDGDDDNNDACTNVCLSAACGDGFVQAGEACDTVEFPAGTQCPAGFTGFPLCNNDPANPGGNNTCTLDPVPDGCTDTDECALGTDTCDANATCANTPGSFTCDCNDGFTGNGFICTDDDECALGTDDCDVNATCANTPGSFTCDCNDGFTGNGVTCTDIDECALGTDNCDVNATCTNTVPGFDCECNDGFTGNGVTCTPDGAGGSGPGGAGGEGGAGNGGAGGGQGGSGNGGAGGQGGSGNGGAGGGQGGSGNGGAGGGQGGSGQGGGEGGGGQGGSGQGGGEGGSGQGGGDGGSGQGGGGQGGNAPAGNSSSTGIPSTGSSGNSSGVDNGSSGTSNPSGGDGGSGDLDGVVASGGLTCAVEAAGSNGSNGSKGAVALVALAGAIVVSRRRKS